MRAPIGLIALALILIAFAAMGMMVVVMTLSARCGPGEHVTRMYTCARR